MTEDIVSFGKTSEALANLIPKILQLDRLERLSKRHPVLAISFSALINQINSCLLATNTIEVGGYKVGPLTFSEQTFEPTWQGKLQAISRSFRIETARLHELMTVEVIGSLAEGIGFELTQSLRDVSKVLSDIVLKMAASGEKIAPELLKTLVAAGV